METTKTGKLGVRLVFFAALAFAFALFDQMLLGGLLLGLVLLVERDEWLGRQCMQALLLQLVGYVAYFAQVFISGLSGLFTYSAAPVLSASNIAGYANAMLGGYEMNIWLVLALLLGVVRLVLALFVVVCAILGLVRVLKGRDAALPLVGKWAALAYNRAPTPSAAPEKPEKDFYDGLGPDDEE